MSRIAYVNGRYVPLRDAAVNVEDRAFQFADGVYEVCEVRGGRLIDEERHVARLRRSLDAIHIPIPMGNEAVGAILREVVRRNRVIDGIVYLQVTRGVAPRNHAFPMKPIRPGIVVTARRVNPAEGERRAADGIAVITLPENRWGRVDIKTVGLLPNVLAKQQARDAGAYEAWFVDRDGLVTEGASTNAWIVTHDGRLVTRQMDHGILGGITRSVLLDMLAADHLTVEQRAFSVDEAMAAAEAFISAASTIVLPVVRIDGRPVGSGKPGPVAKRLRAAFHQHALKAPAWSVHRL
ncbi:MAG: D-amino-acid transaminase [Bauldia sp.]|nr:D-amino-acid transaminase [Bauldia sp.]